MIPSHDVLNERLDGRDRDRKAIEQDDTCKTAGAIREIGEVKGLSEMPTVTEESIAYERIISGRDASGAEKWASGSETPTSVILIEKMVGVGGKRVVLEESLKKVGEKHSTDKA